MFQHAPPGYRFRRVSSPLICGSASQNDHCTRGQSVLSSNCSRSVRPLQMRGVERGEVLGGSQVAQGLMRPGMIVRLLPDPQRRLERRQREIAVVELPELLAMGA